VRAKQLIRAIRQCGFEIIRSKGSHHFLAHRDGRATVVPVHAGEIIGTGLLVKILKDVDMSREQLLRLL